MCHENKDKNIEQCYTIKFYEQVVGQKEYFCAITAHLLCWSKSLWPFPVPENQNPALWLSLRKCWEYTPGHNKPIESSVSWRLLFPSVATTFWSVYGFSR